MNDIFNHVINDQVDLRLLECRHADDLCCVIESNREYLSKWFPWVTNSKTPEDSRAFIESELQRFAKNNGFSAGIFHADQFIGNISFHEINWTTKMTSIGYWISAEYQGRGIMTACCQALLNYGFAELGLNRIEIRARTDNEKSKAIPIRLGFKQEGILRQVDLNHGHYYDHVVFGLLKDEWKVLPWANSKGY
ncbi:GNAT family N-acetyltransferase [Cohnella caldifontis]|uniref:GNAT family N-acetyltransferase n=1 Tax=Cohnella caldifontis TaxID=3027471 RepID=UPI0023EDC3C3|nr:GNAT family protein [Cohnella sp. YIM B05605]